MKRILFKIFLGIITIVNSLFLSIIKLLDSVFSLNLEKKRLEKKKKAFIERFIQEQKTSETEVGIYKYLVWKPFVKNIPEKIIYRIVSFPEITPEEAWEKKIVKLSVDEFMNHEMTDLRVSEPWYNTTPIEISIEGSKDFIVHVKMKILNCTRGLLLPLFGQRLTLNESVNNE